MKIHSPKWADHLFFQIILIRIKSFKDFCRFSALCELIPLTQLSRMAGEIIPTHTKKASPDGPAFCLSATRVAYWAGAAGAAGAPGGAG
jgi:hypothetical protein